MVAIGVQALGGFDSVVTRLGLASLDAGALDVDGGASPDAATRTRRDAASEAVDPSEADAGVDAPLEEALDAFEPPDAFRVLSQREIEDLAKDELDAARADIERGDRRSAETHLARARELDPESSDLEEIEALLAAMP
jgi:hypothetical protein